MIFSEKSLSSPCKKVRHKSNLPVQEVKVHRDNLHATRKKYNLQNIEKGGGYNITIISCRLEFFKIVTPTPFSFGKVACL